MIEANAPGRLGISISIFKLKLALGFKSTIGELGNWGIGELGNWGKVYQKPLVLTHKEKLLIKS
jgi:hypothetical protein